MYTFNHENEKEQKREFAVMQCCFSPDIDVQVDGLAEFPASLTRLNYIVKGIEFLSSIVTASAAAQNDFLLEKLAEVQPTWDHEHNFHSVDHAQW